MECNEQRKNDLWSNNKLYLRSLNKNDEKPSGNAPPQDLPYRPSMRPLEIQRYGNLRKILRNAFRNIRLRNVRLRLYMQ